MPWWSMSISMWTRGIKPARRRCAWFIPPRNGYGCSRSRRWHLIEQDPRVGQATEFNQVSGDRYGGGIYFSKGSLQLWDLKTWMPHWNCISEPHWGEKPGI